MMWRRAGGRRAAEGRRLGGSAHSVHRTRVLLFQDTSRCGNCSIHELLMHCTNSDANAPKRKGRGHFASQTAVLLIKYKREIDLCGRARWCRDAIQEKWLFGSLLLQCFCWRWACWPWALPELPD